MGVCKGPEDPRHRIWRCILGRCQTWAASGPHVCSPPSVGTYWTAPTTRETKTSSFSISQPQTNMSLERKASCHLKNSILYSTNTACHIYILKYELDYVIMWVVEERNEESHACSGHDITNFQIPGLGTTQGCLCKPFKKVLTIWGYTLFKKSQETLCDQVFISVSESLYQFT